MKKDEMFSLNGVVVVLKDVLSDLSYIGYKDGEEVTQAISIQRKVEKIIDSIDNVFKCNSIKYFEVDFNGQCKALIKIDNGVLLVERAMNGWGNAIDVKDINITMTD